MAKKNRKSPFDILLELLGFKRRDDDESGYKEIDGSSASSNPGTDKGTGIGPFGSFSGKVGITINDEILSEDLFRQAGRLYLGKGCDRDISKATDLFERSSKMGNAKSSYVLYKLQYQDAEKKKAALENLRNAANKKYCPAMYDLAIHFLYGDDVEKDTEMAVRMLQECAEHGHTGAISKLYYLFSAGSEVKRDKEKAEIYRSMLRTAKNG